MTIMFIYVSPPPNGRAGRYTLSIIVDGKTIQELGGTICSGCYFQVSLLSM